MEFTERQLATLDAALLAWERRLADGANWIKSVYDFGGHAPLTIPEVQMLRSEIASEVGQPATRRGQEMWKLTIPTFRGAQEEDRFCWTDFTEPNAPVVVHGGTDIRVVMGTHDAKDFSKPDIQIERRPHGWAVFIHPDASDLVACLYILDDGRTFLLPEQCAASELEIVNDAPEDIDAC